MKYPNHHNILSNIANIHAVICFGMNNLKLRTLKQVYQKAMDLDLSCYPQTIDLGRGVSQLIQLIIL